MSTLRLLVLSALGGLVIALTVLTLFPEQLQRAQTQPAPSSAAPSNNSGYNPGYGPVSYADAVAKAAPAVVNIYTSKTVKERRNPLITDPFIQRQLERFMPPRQRRESSLGSGVIVDPRGHVLTNNHVISGADAIVVALQDGREAVARVVGTDPESDLAVLEIQLPSLPVITLAPTEQLQVGDVALAIGNPFGVGQTVTMGIISGTNRNQLGLTTFENFIQTDAAINPGNSGGALINAHGELIGINTAIFSKGQNTATQAQGIGFAIPADLADSILRDILRYGSVIRGWLGADIRPVTEQLAANLQLPSTQGVVVYGIFRNSPAHMAGLKPKDVIVSMDGVPLQTARQGMETITATRPGEQILLDIIRDGKALQLNVTVGARPKAQ